MAIDSLQDRFSLVGLGLPFGRLLPPPDGDFDVEDRQQLLGLYSGLTAGLPSAEIEELPPYMEGLEQVGTYWAPNGSDGFGNVAFLAPVLIECRWQNKLDVISTQPGQQLVSSATVYVDRVMVAKGYVALGDYTMIADPRSVDGPMQIQNFGTSPSLAANEALYKVWL